MTGAREELTDLEHAVLGLVWKEGPCTSYQVRKRFLESPSSHWSGSAGAIYPLMRRLERSGHLRSRPDPRDGRGRRRHEITARGRRALRAWLRPPLPDADVSHAVNPIRTRLFYLSAVEPAEQRALVEHALQRLRQREREVVADCERRRGHDRDGYLGARGVLHAVRARIRWLREVRDELASRTPGDA